MGIVFWEKEEENKSGKGVTPFGFLIMNRTEWLPSNTFVQQKPGSGRRSKSKKRKVKTLPIDLPPPFSFSLT
jgi:hypothetical protein